MLEGYCAGGGTVLKRILLEGDTMLVEDTLLEGVLCWRGYCARGSTVLEWVLCWRGYCAGWGSLAAMPCAATAVHHRDSGPELAMRSSPNTASFQRI